MGLGRSPQVGLGAARAPQCYVCGGVDRIERADPVPPAWIYAGSDEPEDWPSAPICRRCSDEGIPAERALRAFVATRVAIGGIDERGLGEAPPRQIRDGLDRIVRGLHHVLLHSCAPAATTIVMGEPTAALVGSIDAHDFGSDFRVEHASVRLHHRWRITFFGKVTFLVVECPPLSDAVRSLTDADVRRSPRV